PLGGGPTMIVPAHLRADTAIKKPEEVNSRATAPDTIEGSSRDEREPIAPAAPAGSRTITIIDGMSGKRQDVVIPPSPDGKFAPPDERLTESSRHGPLPKVAAAGAGAANAYASPVKAIPG